MPSRCRPRMGAWIEIQLPPGFQPRWEVAPVWGRGLKFTAYMISQYHLVVAPVWGRGLK